MATYIYNCESCEKEFELQRSMKENVGTADCPSCKNVCKQRIQPAVFDSYFEGSYKADNPPRAKW